MNIKMVGCVFLYLLVSLPFALYADDVQEFKDEVQQVEVDVSEIEHNLTEALEVVDGSAENDDELYLLDSIRAVVMSPEGTELVLQSELERPNLSGQFLTLEECVQERCFYLDACKHKVSATEDQIDRSLAAVQRDNNLTLEELKTMFAANGLTLSDAREQLGRMQSVSTILEIKIHGNMLIPRKKVIAYYQEYPETKPAVYHLQRAVVSFDQDRDAQYNTLVTMAESGECDGGIAWSSVFSVDNSDLADDKVFIHDAHVGDILVAGKVLDGFELYRLVDKTEEVELTLEERYPHIEALLRKPLYEELLAAYKEKLFDKMTITYL